MIAAIHAYLPSLPLVSCFIMSSRLQIATFCIGGYSLKVSNQLKTRACAGAITYIRSSRQRG